MAWVQTVRRSSIANAISTESALLGEREPVASPNLSTMILPALFVVYVG